MSKFVRCFFLTRIAQTNMDTISEFFDNYIKYESDQIIQTVSDFKSPFYTWFFLLTFIKIYRKLNNI